MTVFYFACGFWEKYDIKDKNTSKLILSAHKQDTTTNDPLVSDNICRVFVDDQELTDVEQTVLERIFCDVRNLYFEEKYTKTKREIDMLYQEMLKQMQK